MGWDYALVHFLYTIPPGLILTVVLAPLLTRLDLYKVSFLITVAVVWTTPWDSYLIHKGIWTYPPESIIGPTLFRIPLEEFFFFIIQTYTTSLLYILVNKSTLFPVHLDEGRHHDLGQRTRLLSGQYVGQAIIIGLMLSQALIKKEQGTYMQLIVLWSGPILLLLWSLTHQMLMSLPLTKTLLPILLPTAYLWLVDTIALRRGTWAITADTKWGFQPWPGMEIEEAVFFLITNTLVVFGLVAFDNAVAVVDLFPSQFPKVLGVPSPKQMVEALLLPASKYDPARLEGLREALNILHKKSRSFYLASSVFAGRLRIDLILLYAYCRVADDLVDNASTPDEAGLWIEKLTTFLDYQFQTPTSEAKHKQLKQDLLSEFPLPAQKVLLQVPTSRISQQPLYDLLNGFRTDLNFSMDSSNPTFPIKTSSDLALYAYQVASTVAILCLDLVYFHHPQILSPSRLETKGNCVASAIAMGQALQYINIARDVVVDAQNSRCYLPSQWLEGQDPKVTPDMTISHRGQLPPVTVVRQRLLHEAMRLYHENVDAIEDLPVEARGGIRVAVEAYVEIGRVMLRTGFSGVDAHGGAGRKATVPRWRRILVAWLGMAGFGRRKSSALTNAR